MARSGGGRWTIECVHALFPRLAERGRNRANKPSGAEQQMLTIGWALMTNPDLLLLDEPTEGLAPLLVREVSEEIGQLKLECVSILSRGQGVLSSRPDELLANEDVKLRYLGVA